MADRRYDVAVVGGGIAGCASAYYLALTGLKVVVLEKGEIAGEQSGRNWGFVRQQGRDPREIPLMMACNRIWRGLPAALDADIEWRPGGLLYLAEDEGRLAEYEAWLRHARDFQLDSRLLSGRQAADLLPGLAGTWAGALHTPSDGQADPVKTTRAFAAAASRHGAEVRTGCIVEAVETAGGAVAGLRCEDGILRADAVLVATGVWTSRFLRPLGIDLPQLAVRATVLRTTPAPAATALSVGSHGVGFRQRRDGSFNVGPGAGIADFYLSPDGLRYGRRFWPSYRSRRQKIGLRLGGETVDGVRHLFGGQAALVRQMARQRVLSPAPNEAAVGRAFAAFRRLLPGLGDLAVDRTWAGMIEASPDELPVLDSIPGIRGLAVATGFSGHGFGMGPIAGRLMAELIAGGKPSLDLRDFRFSRFAAPEEPRGDGSV